MIVVRVRVTVLNTTINNISILSWRSVLLVEETGVPGEIHRPVVNHRITLSHTVSSTPRDEQDCTSSCKSNYYTITTTTPLTIILIEETRPK